MRVDSPSPRETAVNSSVAKPSHFIGTRDEREHEFMHVDPPRDDPVVASPKKNNKTGGRAEVKLVKPASNGSTVQAREPDREPEGSRPAPVGEDYRRFKAAGFKPTKSNGGLRGIGSREELVQEKIRSPLVKTPRIIERDEELPSSGPPMPDKVNIQVSPEAIRDRCMCISLSSVQISQSVLPLYQCPNPSTIKTNRSRVHLGALLFSVSSLLIICNPKWFVIQI